MERKKSRCGKRELLPGQESFLLRNVCYETCQSSSHLAPVLDEGYRSSFCSSTSPREM